MPLHTTQSASRVAMMEHPLLCDVLLPRHPFTFSYVEFLRMAISLGFVLAQQIAESHHPIKFYSMESLFMPPYWCVCVRSQ